ncbi:hypothetical protein [Maribacter sp.]|uniref:hypothetical protein n=1 Tax=Maribacter sp. TaxID=1897614 RepID=UPI0025B8FB39|nr:hypothetical protein [Maribacter sp.]
MIRFLKISTVIILILLFIATLVMLMFQNMVSLIAMPTGILFVYYLVVFFLISFLKERRSNQVLSIIVWLLFLVPLLWLLVDPYSLFELMMPKINLDMK